MRVTKAGADAVVKQAAKVRIKKSKHGRAGERYVYRYKLPQESPKPRCKYISPSHKDAGYDILVTREGKQEFHEVKASQSKYFIPSKWHISAKQYQKSQENLDSFFFWFVNNIRRVGPKPTRKYRADQLEFKPSRYQICVRTDVPCRQLSFDASKLLDELGDIQTHSSRTLKSNDPEDDEKQLKLAIYTRIYLAKQLAKRTGMNKAKVNIKTTNTLPYHLQYYDDTGKEVRVDLKVRKLRSSLARNQDLRFVMTAPRLDDAKSLTPDSCYRREYWLCSLDETSKKLYVRIYDISSKNFFENEGVNETIDYYSFKVKDGEESL